MSISGYVNLILTLCLIYYMFQLKTTVNISLYGNGNSLHTHAFGIVHILRAPLFVTIPRNLPLTSPCYCMIIARYRRILHSFIENRGKILPWIMWNYSWQWCNKLSFGNPLNIHVICERSSFPSWTLETADNTCFPRTSYLLELLHLLQLLSSFSYVLRDYKIE